MRSAIISLQAVNLWLQVQSERVKITMLERIAFLVERLTSYRVLGALIEESLRQGIKVYLLLRNTPDSRKGPKGYDWADPLRVPAFKSGFPEIYQWKSLKEIECLCQKLRIQAVFSIWLYPEFYPLLEILKKQGIRWISLQHATEHLVMPKDSLLLPDAVCFYSDYWIQHAIYFFEDVNSQALKEKLVATGFPELDLLYQIKPDEIREKYNIPQNLPVVLWLPHDRHPYDLWESLIFRREWRIRSWVRLFLSGKTELLKRRSTDPSLSELFRNVRDFCKKNGAFLITKSRVKDCPTAVEKSLPDLFTFDRDPHPPTILELLSIANLCIHFFSAVALEAAGAGVPTLCLTPPDCSDFMNNPDTGWRRTAGDLRAEGTLWNFPGVNYQWSLEEALDSFRKARLDDFVMEKSKIQDYLKKFVGPVDGRSSERVLNYVKELVN